ncbi:MAG: sigma-54-dependent Fis family transcriptional regulator [Bacteroidetes bacterium]|nr:sigma-54-dependent Fis family transcriptional regulator [Bacteroidota bacterium]
MSDKDLQGVKQRFGIIGNSPLLNNALRTALQVASTDLTILISGESGVGKEVFSQIIHSNSSRKHNPFIAINCGAIPEGTIDSELFGHEKGAFTGAHEARKGYFESVKDGTIFLDEVSEMPRSTQARLLRVIESGEFIRVGSSNVQKTNVRVIVATNRDLLHLIRLGKFREDLYYRLNTVPIYIPPLRERKEDILILFKKFSADFADRYKTDVIKLEEGAVSALVEYRWPGNVRQLKNIAEQISAISGKNILTLEDLKNFLPDSEQESLPILADQVEREKESYSERELMYRILFELKKDVNQLKQIFADKLPDKLNADLPVTDLSTLSDTFQNNPVRSNDPRVQANNEKIGNDPVILSEKEISQYKEAEIVEESLTISDREKELIIKALNKHKSRRKEAAKDLGISERTLYRKIKEYDIEL